MRSPPICCVRFTFILAFKDFISFYHRNKENIRQFISRYFFMCIRNICIISHFLRFTSRSSFVLSARKKHKCYDSNVEKFMRIFGIYNRYRKESENCEATRVNKTNFNMQIFLWLKKICSSPHSPQFVIFQLARVPSSFIRIRVDVASAVSVPFSISGEIYLKKLEVSASKVRNMRRSNGQQ